MTDTPPEREPAPAQAGTEPDERQRRLALLAMLEDLQASRAQIERARKEWADAFDAVRDPIFLHDREFRVVRANRAYAEAAGMDIRDVAGKRYWEVFPKNTGPLPACARHMEKAEEEEEEVRLETGEVFLSRSFVVRDTDGQYLYSIHILENVTEKRRAEQTLKEQEQAYRTLAENLPGIVYRVFVREGNRMQLFNRVAADVTGYTPDELTTGEVCSIEPIILPEDRPQVVAEVKRAVQEAKQFTVEYRLRTKNGNIRNMLEQGTPISGPDGRPLYIDGVIFDITERKRAAETLRQSAAELKEAQRVARLGNWSLDTETGNVTWSEELYRIFGLDPARAAPGYEEHPRIMTPESYARMNTAIGNTRQTGEPYELDLELVRPDGTRKWITARGEARRDSSGRIVGLRGTALDITERKRAEQLLERSNRALTTLSGVNQALIKVQDERSLLSETCRVIVETGGYRFAWIGYVEHDGEKTVRPVAYRGFEEGYLESLRLTWGDTERGRGPSGRAIRSGKPVFTQDILNDPAFAPWRAEAVARGYASSISLPLLEADTVFGVLSIYSAEAGAFDAAEVVLLQELADDLAFGLLTLRLRNDRNRLQEEHLNSGERLKVALTDTIRAIALTVEKRDPYTAGHQQRVAELCFAIGRELGLDESRLEGLRLGATIHDIGKIYVPAEILNRPGKLSKAEFEMIQTHPEVGYDIVKDVKFPWPVGEMILQHHERMDGSGYPKGLKGEAICLEARILAVADVVEAMASHRPYRPAHGIEAALKEIERHRGEWYEPAVADACLKLFREKGFRFSPGGEEKR